MYGLEEIKKMNTEAVKKAGKKSRGSLPCSSRRLPIKELLKDKKFIDHINRGVIEFMRNIK